MAYQELLHDMALLSHKGLTYWLTNDLDLHFVLIFFIIKYQYLIIHCKILMGNAQISCSD